MGTRESIYLEKRNFEPIRGGIKDNINLCNKIVDLYENESIYSEDLIHIVSVINDVKPGASFADNIYMGKKNLNSAHEIRDSKLYNTLVEFEVPFRVDVYGEIKSDNPHHVEITDNSYPLYNIARNFSDIERLPPFHHLGSENKMFDVEKKYMKSWGDFLGVPKEDCAWMIEEQSFNSNKIPSTIKGLAYKKQLKYENIDYACLVPYKPYPSKYGIERAIDTGKKYYNSVKKFDDKMNVDYGMKEVEGRIARFKLYFKTDIIKSELYNLYDDEPIKENILIEKIHDEHNFSEDFIKNKLQDIAFSSQSSIIKRGAEYKIMTDK